jgi:methylase of polypeptide subunit release factors
VGDRHDLLEPIPRPVELIVANLPYLPDERHDPLYDGEPPDAVYAPGDGLGPYRSLLDACRDGKLETGGTLLIQFHQNPLVADCWQLEDLREQLESSAYTR